MCCVLQSFPVVMLLTAPFVGGVVGWLASRSRVSRLLLQPWLVGVAAVTLAALQRVPTALAVALHIGFTVGRRLHVIGLTGGVGTGKSSVSRVWRDQRRATIVDADVIAREVVQQGKPAYRDIVARFGDAVLLSSGELNRDALGKLVFSDAAARRAVNAATHPRIARAMLTTVLWQRVVLGRRVVLDAPLLLESGALRRLCHPVVVVFCEHDVEVQRVVARDGCDAAAAAAKISAQVQLWNSGRCGVPRAVTCVSVCVCVCLFLVRPSVD